MKAIDFTADNGFKYKARLLTEDDRFGHLGCLKHSDDNALNEPVVEFYVQTHRAVFKDLRWAGIDEPWGFVSRYYISSFRGRDGRGAPAHGLCLDGGSRQLDLSQFDCQFVDLWLRKVHGV